MKLDALQLSDRRVAVIGGTNGIGRAIARAMAERGASVTVVGQTFRDAGGERLGFIKADLSLMAEARRIGQTLPAGELDLVLFTTGIMAAPERQLSAEGLERDMAVSYLSRLQTVRELAPRMRPRKHGKPRIFVMGFPGTDQKAALDDLNADRHYEAMPVHMQTVAGNEALVLDGVKRYPDVLFFGLNPGLIATDIRANYLGPGSLRHRIVERLIGLFMISAEQYAARITPLLFSPDLEPHSGAMFNQKAIAIAASHTMTPAYVSDLIAASEALLARAATAVAAPA